MGAQPEAKEKRRDGIRMPAGKGRREDISFLRLNRVRRHFGTVNRKCKKFFK